jgi:hypothetical protein
MNQGLTSDRESFFHFGVHQVSTFFKVADLNGSKFFTSFAVKIPAD